MENSNSKNSLTQNTTLININKEELVNTELETNFKPVRFSARPQRSVLKVKSLRPGVLSKRKLTK